MYEVRVTEHEYEKESQKNYIRIIKMFRMVTAFGLKESKDAVEAMIGKGEWLDQTGIPTPRNGPFYKTIERVPFVFKCETYIRARQVQIEFQHGGFTAEVHKTDG